MKCQKCEKPATFHITELTTPQVMEVHLCNEHAQQYLMQGEEPDETVGSLAGMLAQQFKASQTAEELAKIDQKACPVCGITFYEFRNQGRLGCPHDYVFFADELEPLLVNIHRETRHVGKHPRRGEEGTDSRTEMIRLRREMKEAVDREDYEQASRLRDEIRKLEGKSP